MVQKVTVPDVGVVNFPDSMSAEEITKALQAMVASAAPKQPQTVTEKVLASPVGGVIRGLRDIPDAGAQMLTRGLEAIAPAGSSMEKFMQEERKRVEEINRQAEQAYQKEWRQGQMKAGEVDVGRAIGGVLGTAVPATRAVQALGLATAPVRAGAVSGAVGGALQPVAQPQESFAEQKATQVGLGAALGAGGGYLGDKLTQILFGRGAAPSAAATSATGEGAQSAEAILAATPSAQVTGGSLNCRAKSNLRAWQSLGL